MIERENEVWMTSKVFRNCNLSVLGLAKQGKDTNLINLATNSQAIPWLSNLHVGSWIDVQQHFERFQPDGENRRRSFFYSLRVLLFHHEKGGNALVKD
jgi:hypothetical protein